MELTALICIRYVSASVSASVNMPGCGMPQVTPDSQEQAEASRRISQLGAADDDGTKSGAVCVCVCVV